MQILENCIICKEFFSTTMVYNNSMRLVGLKTIKCASTPEINLIYIRYENFQFLFHQP